MNLREETRIQPKYSFLLGKGIKKVQFSLEQAMKGQRDSRCKANKCDMTNNNRCE
jgi:hypothetical protein